MTGDPLAPQTTWSHYTASIYLGGIRPVIGSYDHRSIEGKAREVMKDNHCASAQFGVSQLID
jgi:hypothetical protein